MPPFALDHDPPVALGFRSSSPSLDLVVGHCSSESRWKTCLRSTLTSRYFYANIVYVLYCTCMLFIDFYDFGTKVNNDLYYTFGIIHFINAWMYWYAWKGRSWKDPVVYPEYLNVLGALLYLWSSALYHKEGGPLDDSTHHVHMIETSAAIVELIACVGWAFTWHATYVRVPGRGYTLDDPDVWALMTIFLGAVVYVSYNIKILIHPEQYGTERLYFFGDIFYFANGFLYLIASLRDDGWFWFMPLAGGYSDPYSQALIYRHSFATSDYATSKQKQLAEALLATSAVLTTPTTSSTPTTYGSSSNGRGEGGLGPSASSPCLATTMAAALTSAHKKAGSSLSSLDVSMPELLAIVVSGNHHHHHHQPSDSQQDILVDATAGSSSSSGSNNNNWR